MEANKANGIKFDLKSSVKFIIKRKNLQDRISSMKDATSAIQRLRRYCTELRQDDRKRKLEDTERLAAHVGCVHSWAGNLYRAVLNELSLYCHEKHQIRFFLEARTAALYDRETSIDFKITLVAYGNQADNPWRSPPITITLLHNDFSKSISC